MQEYIIIISSATLLLFLLWKEIKRVDRSFLAIRMIATTVAVTMLVLLVIPVKYDKKISTASSNVLLITPGAGRTADSFSRYKQVTTDPSKISSAVSYIPDLSVFIEQHRNEMAVLHITGTGIEEHEWKMLDSSGIQTRYTAASPRGLIQAEWPGVIQFGYKLRLSGTYNNRGEEKIKIVLSGLGTSLDSIVIAADSIQTFSLSCLPAHTGNTLYELQLFREEKLVETEKIPVIIKQPVRPQILFLSSSPGFENKFLQTWLYENNYPVAIRNTVSRDRSDQQFLNMRAMQVKNISSALLDEFDLLVADDNALAELPATASADIRTQLEKGMGLIIQSDSSAAISSFSRAFAVKKQAEQKTSPRILVWQGITGKSNPLAAEQWFSIRQDPFAQAVVTDDRQEVIAACRLYGSGKVLLNTAASTYNWMLAGNKENYSSFWSLLISKAARGAEKNTGWRYSPGFATVNRQIKLELETSGEQSPVIKTESGELYTAQTPYLPDTWTANWWPAHPGWQTLSCTDTASIYVFEEKDWIAARQTEQIKNNIVHTGKQTSIRRKETITQTNSKTIPVWPFYIGLLAACSFLWWESRLR